MVSTPTSITSRYCRDHLHFREFITANWLDSMRGIISKHRSPGDSRRALRGGSDKRLRRAVHRVSAKNRGRAGGCGERFLRSSARLLFIERKKLVGDVELLGVFEEKLESTKEESVPCRSRAP